MEFAHKPVLFDQAVEALNIKPDGIYLDGTAGGGGHSRAVAERLTGGRLFCIDRDPDAVKVLREKFGGDKRVDIVQNNFVNIKKILTSFDIDKIDGILLDLGVSSFQLDNAERGFSFHKDAPLDMRMSKSGTTAAELVNSLSERELADIFWKYGEERFSANIAKNIVVQRRKKPFETTLELAETVKYSIPAAKRRQGGHPARRVFQALRIEVNGELDRLSAALDDMLDCLCTGGRLAVITFHSLEDRIVKQRFASWLGGCTCPRDFPVCVCGGKPKVILPFKYKEPTIGELSENPRSRSARLRVVEKLQ